MHVNQKEKIAKLQMVAQASLFRLLDEFFNILVEYFGQQCHWKNLIWIVVWCI